MTGRPLYLVDGSSRRVADLDVDGRGGDYEGTIRLDGISPDLRRLFDEFEAVVEGQVFALLDDIEARIAAVDFRAAFDDGTESPVADLQVFPSTGGVSFKIRQPTPVVRGDSPAGRMTCETNSTESTAPGPVA